MILPTFKQNRRSWLGLSAAFGTAGVGALCKPVWAQGRPDIVWRAEAHEDWVRAVAFSPDGALLASGSDDESIQLRRVSDGSLLHTLTGHSRYVEALRFWSEGDVLASGADDDAVGLWNVSDGSLIRMVDGPGDFLWTVAISPDGQTVASAYGGVADMVILWRISDGVVMHTLDSDIVGDLAFSPDGQWLASGAAFGGDRQVKLWRVSDGMMVRAMDHDDYLSSVAFSPDGALLASGSADGTTKLWRVSDGSLVHSLDGWATALSFTSDGGILAGGSHINDTLSLWRASDGALLRRYDESVKGIFGVEFSPDDLWVGYGQFNGNVAIARNPFAGEPDCGPDARLSVKCRDDGMTVIGTLKNAVANTEVIFTLDGGNARARTTNEDGKAKVKYKNQTPQSHIVRVCDLSRDC
ncbi:MAG: hypothetical protein FLDDKLPJ_02666 [Phycisphaerae bacterium]|nr:hypothetical protein [Phycisphaerae bacterium]